MKFVVSNSIAGANEPIHPEADKPRSKFSFKKATEPEASDNFADFTLLPERSRHAPPLQSAANDEHHNRFNQRKHIARQKVHKAKEAFISATMMTAIFGISSVVDVVNALTKQQDLSAKTSEPKLPEAKASVGSPNIIRYTNLNLIRRYPKVG